MRTELVKLDILSDPICPWCYIGKAELDQALADHGEDVFEVEWHPFQLNPDMPKEGMDRQAYLVAKFGGPENAAEVYGRVADAAKASGLNIDFEAIARTPNTLDAHRMIHWAGIEGAQHEMVGRLFEAFFRENRDIGDHDTLADLADDIGLDASVFRKLLGSDVDRDNIAARDRNSRERGVTGVPTFIVGKRHAVPGMQPTALWRQVLSELSETQD